ncbi:galactokinase [Ophiostoma piceae UAMH 11346]|uniref:Galactokinase n=1 Tax=Ophiostoma piceae (strain UAMH 11346) TaxID=1262450 RepID=S3CR47_OPHP1|nr:galactokinase [Ophiostoma piceae UAMH 11346]
MSVPLVGALADIYPADVVAAQTQRWQHLAAVFAEKFGGQPDFVARSPGRVNVIGEHIDYSLYSVLPMAITGDCIIAVRAVDSLTADFTVDIANVLSDKFPAHSFTFADNKVDIDASVLEWTNYFKSGLKGAVELLIQKNSGLKAKSLQVVMDGTVPVGGGLSSSAAFTSASALAVMYANSSDKIDKTELTEVAIVSERNVGVNSGGMDQSASVFSLAGSALFVTFTPTLTARPVFFPETKPELCFLIAQSFVTANKFVTGPIHYNLRVVECTLAAAYLNAVANPPGTALRADNGPLGVSLHGFQQAYFGAESSKTKSQKEQLQDLLVVTEKYLPDDGYTREQIAAALNTTIDDLNARYMARFPVRAEQFKLRQRATHVFSEALRVLEFMELLESGSTDINSKLGDLMNATQTSCRELYECSCAELDELCRIARDAGSYGSRLTGAGWGGCSVHLVPVDRVEAIRAAWDEHYYSKLQLTPEQKEGAVIVSRPGSGSVIFAGSV